MRWLRDLNGHKSSPAEGREGVSAVSTGQSDAGGGASLALGITVAIALAQPRHQTTPLDSPTLQPGLVPGLSSVVKANVLVWP